MEDIDDVSRAQEHRIDLDLAEEGLGDVVPEPFLFWIGVSKVYPPKPR